MSYFTAAGQVINHARKIVENLDTIDHEPAELLELALESIRALVSPIKRFDIIPREVVGRAVLILTQIRKSEDPKQIFTKTDDPAPILKLLLQLENSLRVCQWTHYGSDRFDYVQLSENRR